ncbi:MAG TPA: GAF domain-containing protein [Anaerolineae bacterium]|nr:GAF domain-containing protein [Anaerolineae bacterium]
MTPLPDPAPLGSERIVTTQAEEADPVRRERDWLSAVLDAAGAFVVVLDREGRIVRFNRACEAATGFSLEHVRGLTPWNLLLSPEESGPLPQVFEQLDAVRFPVEHESHWRTRERESLLIAWTYTAVLGAGGTVDFVVGTGVEITERAPAVAQGDAGLELLRGDNRLPHEEMAKRRVAEEALRDTEGHLRSLMESAERYAIFRLAVDPTHPYGLRILLASPSLKELLGLTELTDVSSWIANIHPDDLERVVRANTRSIETGTLFDEQYRVRRPHPGEWGWVHNRSMPVFDAEGRLTHYNGLMVDVSEQKATERTLQAVAEFEDAIAEVSGSFINLTAEQVDEGIQRALELIGTAYHVERAYVFQFSGDRSLMDCTHEWCAPGIEPQIDRLKDLPADHFAWTVGQIARSQVVQVRCDSDLPPEADAERAELESLGLKARIVIPMVYHDALVGFVGFDSMRRRLWTEQSLKLRVIGDILVNALERKRSQEIQVGQQHFLELLATGGDFSETLQTLVRLIEDQWPGMLGLILLLDEDGKHLHIGASVRLPADYVRSIEGLEIGPMVGSCGTACYRRERVVVEDTATDPRWMGLRDLALQYGLRACWSEPVFSPDRKVVGTFAMYYCQPRAPTEAELRAIEMCAHLLGVAIEHRRAEQALQESEVKFRGIVELANVGIAIVQDARFRFVNRHWAAMLGYTVEELLGTEFMPYCTPEERDRIVDYHTRRTRGEPAPTRYETAMVHKSGSHVYAEVSVGMIPYEGRQATFVFLRDITEQKNASQALVDAYRTLEQRVEDRTRELSTLLEVSQKLASTLELGPLLGSILDELKSVVRCEGSTVYALEGDKLVARAYRGRIPQERVMSLRWEADNPLDGPLLTGRKPVLVADTRADSPEAEAYRESLGELQDTLFPHIRSWLGVPLVAKGQVIGNLTLHDSRPNFLTRAHAGFSMAFANQAAVAIENARLYAAEQQRKTELAVLNSIAAVVSGSLDLKEILSAALGKTLDATAMDFGTAYSVEGDAERTFSGSESSANGLDTAGQDLVREVAEVSRGTKSHPSSADHLQLLAHRGVSAGYAHLVRHLPLPGSAALTHIGKPLVWLVEEVIPADTDLRRVLEQEGCRQVVTVPLVAKSSLVGAINLGTRTPRSFAPEQLTLLAAIGQQVGLAVDNARLYEAQQSRREEAERRRRVAEGLRDILAILNSNRPLGEILDYIVTHASGLLGSDGTTLCRLDRKSQLLTIQASHGLSAEFLEHMAFQVGRVSIISEAVVTRRPTATSNLAERLAHPDIPVEAREMAARFSATYRTVLAVPILLRSEVYGALALYYQAERQFSDEEINLSVTFADQAALAIENARLREQVEQAAAMQERGRLARELHDSVTQSLYSVTMYTEAAARLLPPSLEAAAEHLRDARDTAQEALREMRLMIYQLRPPVLEKGGLAVALQVRLDAVERRGGMRADLIVEGEDRLSPSVQAELHQIAHEALNNALKHAHARQVKVHLEFGDAVARLAVQDDGLGFDPEDAKAGGGLGLPGMRERAQKIGGQLEIESAPGRGARIVVEVPIGGRE